MNALSIFASFAEAVGLMALLATAIGSLERSRLPGGVRSGLVGLAFGLAALVAMLSPAVVAPGIIMDGRSVIVGLGAAFGGPIAAVIAATIAGTYRAVVIGGAGALPGTIGIFVAAATGLLWMRFVVRGTRPTLLQLMLGGFLLSLNFAVVFLLPMAIALPMVTTIYPMLLAMAMIGTLVLGGLIERERRLDDLQRELASAALIDPLTGLPNRRNFAEAFARARGRTSCLVLLDIDRFKTVNDGHGHAAGDEALRSFSRILGEEAGPTATVARMGGEEFAILLDGASGPEAEQAVAEVLSAVRRAPIHYGGTVFRVTASAGVAEFTPGRDSVDSVLRRADLALYEAKRGGRDRYSMSDLAAAA